MLFIFISRFITVKSHGPAVTLQITNRYNGTAYTIDLTLALKCFDWPREAHEWRMRCRSGKSVTLLLFQREDVIYFLN